MWIVGRRSRWGIEKTYPRVRLSGTRHATPLNDWIQSIRSNPMDSIEWILLIGAGRLTQGHQIYIKNCRAFLAWPGMALSLKMITAPRRDAHFQEIGFAT